MYFLTLSHFEVFSELYSGCYCNEDFFVQKIPRVSVEDTGKGTMRNAFHSAHGGQNY